MNWYNCINYSRSIY